MFELPPLPYTYDALEPYIDARTVEIHHDKHHATYTTNFNNAIKGTDLEKKSLIEIFDVIEQYPIAVRNNAGGYANHNLYWQILGPKGVSFGPTEELSRAIENTFGSFESFKEKLSSAAMSVFGSGWAWLVVTPEKKLAICTTALQDNPMMTLNGTQKGYPILGIDLWEHSYYLSYQNRRADYVKNIFHIINWHIVGSLYKEALAYFDAKEIEEQPNTPLGEWHFPED